MEKSLDYKKVEKRRRMTGNCTLEIVLIKVQLSLHWLIASTRVQFTLVDSISQCTHDCSMVDSIYQLKILAKKNDG